MNFKFYFICLDDDVYSIINKLQLKNLIAIPVQEIESFYKELTHVKKKRKVHEYAWTLKPSALLFIFEHFHDVDNIIWIDGDMEFLSDTIPVYDKWGAQSVLLVDQLYTGPYEYLVNTYGKYQGGFVGFKKNKTGIACLKWWQQKCIDWCFEKPDSGRWTDQKYIDEFEERFKDVVILEGKAINLTPFAIYRFNSELNKKIEKQDGCIYLDDKKIILYHYYGFKYYNSTFSDLCCYWMMFDEATIKNIYIPYINKYREAMEFVKSIDLHFFKIEPIVEKHILNYFNLELSSKEQCYYFCSIANTNNYTQLTNFYYSLINYFTDFHLFVCCMEKETYDLLKSLKLENATFISISNIENSELINLRKNISISEYIHVVKPFFIYFLLKNNYNLKHLLYINPSTLLIRDPSGIFDFFDKASIISFAQKNLRKNKLIEQNVNKDLIGFKRDSNAFNFLYSWMDKINNNGNITKTNNKIFNQMFTDANINIFQGIKIESSPILKIHCIY